MAAEKIFVLRHAKHPTSEIAGVTHGRFSPGVVKKTDPGSAGDAGDAETLVTHMSLGVTVFGTDYAALLALVGATVANLILGTSGAARGPREDHHQERLLRRRAPGHGPAQEGRARNDRRLWRHGHRPVGHRRHVRHDAGRGRRRVTRF